MPLAVMIDNLNSNNYCFQLFSTISKLVILQAISIGFLLFYFLRFQQNKNFHIHQSCSLLLLLLSLSSPLILLLQGFWNYVLFFSANYALFFGQLCVKNSKLCANYANCTILHNIFKQKLLMFQFIKLANLH